MEVIVSDEEKVKLTSKSELENKIVLLGKKITNFSSIKEVYIPNINRTFI